MRITAEWIQDYATRKGGWTQEQLRILGVSWPPKSGWLDKLVGQELSNEKAQQFQQLSPRGVQRIQLVAQWLTEFWSVAADFETPQERLRWLKKFASRVAPKSKRHQTRTRRMFGKVRQTRAWAQEDIDAARVCYVCWQLAQCEHHIIQIQHGGDNRLENRIPLCTRCYTDVHPWMKRQ